ncbi:DNA polymerase sliding clamp loader subunit [Ochrobactrum phage vB_OspM_OC]|nr:DNA polymerase sliding clamp loader subunit [Ochrobactrum phage vB_OspM_OC]
MSEEKEINIFDLVKSINKKEYMFSPDMEGKLYNQFVINKAFANCKDSILYANMANQMPNMTDEMNYDFYYYALPKGYRFGKWFKKHESDEIQLVMQVYNVSYRKACEIAGLLNEQQKEELEKVLFKGGRRDV